LSVSSDTTMYTEANTIIGEGWRALVDRLGLHKATQFVVLLERGKGDSVQEIAEYWGDASIDEIYMQVQIWKANRLNETPEGVG
jgi:hypothetical protein